MRVDRASGLDLNEATGTFMDHVISDWQRADDAHLRTYKGVMHLALYGAVTIIIILALMAFFLL